MDSYKYNLRLSTAMAKWNESNNTPHFSILDCSILCVINSGLHEACATDEELSRLLITSTRTIQRVIDKLCAFGFITKQIIYNNKQKKRKLIIQHNTINNFIAEYFNEEEFNSEHPSLVVI